MSSFAFSNGKLAYDWKNIPHLKKSRQNPQQNREIEFILINTDTNVFRSKPVTTNLPAAFHLLEIWNAFFLEMIGEDIQTWMKYFKSKNKHFFG